MSVVGCSGEDFASILKALGFRRERKSMPAEVPAAGSASTSDEAVEKSAVTASSTIALDEVWRPVKRKDARQQRTKDKQLRRERKTSVPRHREQKPARLERKQRSRASDSSPFAVLAELRRNLVARRPEGN